MKQIFFSILLISMLTGLPVWVTQAADSPHCGINCEVNFTTAKDVEDAVSAFFGGDSAPVIVVKNSETGVFRVTLANGKMFSLAPVGLTLRYRNRVEQQMMETEEGHVRFRSQSGVEIQLRSEFHNQVQAMGELLRLGWENVGWFGDRIEIDSPAGERMCFAPDMEIIAGAADGATSITTDADGNLQIRYQDGIQQRLHACAHDMVQLRDQVRSTLRLQLQTHTDGTISVQQDGLQHRYRLRATLRWSGILDQPGFFTEESRLRFRYRDGWEQEIVSMP
ncbi:hypothetical protein [Nitrosomonas sp.]|uniref:hypothetical protein n=1 Tax=Nitrosomonas sp. TaxID=42353 RepID=UPI0035AEB2F4